GDEREHERRHRDVPPLDPAHRRVLLLRDLVGVPRGAALLALPELAVVQIAHLAAPARHGDRRPAQTLPGAHPEITVVPIQARANPCTYLFIRVWLSRIRPSARKRGGLAWRPQRMAL